MRTNWQIKKLDEVCDFYRGLTYSKKDEVGFSENIVLRSNNIELLNSSLDLNELRYINNKIVIPDNKKVKKGSIILCTANGSKSHLGKIALIDKNYGYAFGGFMGQLIPRKEINSKYFFYILSSDLYKKHLAKISSGANINNLKFSDLSELQIPLPPLPEQHRIVKILDEVFDNIAKAKANTEKNLQNSKDLFQSYLQSVFANPGKDWEEKKLSDFFDITSSKRVFKSEWKNKGVPFYRAREIVKLAKQGFVKNELFISEEMYKKYSEKYGIPKEGDIMVTGVGTLGICYVVKQNDKFYFKDGNIIWLKTKGNINSYFVEYFFNSPVFKKYINSANGATVGTFTIIKAKNSDISVPSLTEQKSIVAKLDELSVETKKLESIYKQKLADLEELKKSVLKKAFSGEL